jgi:hypothetical protein
VFHPRKGSIPDDKKFADSFPKACVPKGQSAPVSLTLTNKIFQIPDNAARASNSLNFSSPQELGGAFPVEPAKP